jgi:hypothetical protein
MIEPRLVSIRPCWQGRGEDFPWWLAQSDRFDWGCQVSRTGCVADPDDVSNGEVKVCGWCSRIGYTLE